MLSLVALLREIKGVRVLRGCWSVATPPCDSPGRLLYLGREHGSKPPLLSGRREEQLMMVLT